MVIAEPEFDTRTLLSNTSQITVLIRLPQHFFFFLSCSGFRSHSEHVQFFNHSKEANSVWPLSLPQNHTELDAEAVQCLESSLAIKSHFSEKKSTCETLSLCGDALSVRFPASSSRHFYDPVKKKTHKAIKASRKERHSVDGTLTHLSLTRSWPLWKYMFSCTIVSWAPAEMLLWSFGRLVCLYYRLVMSCISWRHHVAAEICWSVERRVENTLSPARSRSFPLFCAWDSLQGQLFAILGDEANKWPAHFSVLSPLQIQAIRSRKSGLLRLITQWKKFLSIFTALSFVPDRHARIRSVARQQATAFIASEGVRSSWKASNYVLISDGHASPAWVTHAAHCTLSSAQEFPLFHD